MITMTYQPGLTVYRKLRSMKCMNIHILKKYPVPPPNQTFFSHFIGIPHTVIQSYTRIYYIYMHTVIHALKNLSSNNHRGPKNSMETQPLTAGAERFCCGPRRPTVVQKFQGRRNGGFGAPVEHN